jgi:hypothetical protein
MIGKWYRPAAPPHRRRAPALAAWQRLLAAGALAVALLISAALIYFQPGTRSFTLAEAERAAPATQAAPAQPPGIETYYYWGQHRPLDQQP